MALLELQSAHDFLFSSALSEENLGDLLCYGANKNAVTSVNSEIFTKMGFPQWCLSKQWDVTFALHLTVQMFQFLEPTQLPSSL